MESSYAYLVLPLKLTIEVSYLIPPSLVGRVKRGSYVRVEFSGREYSALVYKVYKGRPSYSGEIKEIISIEERREAREEELQFQNWISRYYMCSLGEVFKAANSGESGRASKVEERGSPLKLPPTTQIELSNEQQIAYETIIQNGKEGKTSLLRGVTGSGKTEIYIKLAYQMLLKGKSALIMVPEVALSRELTKRFEKIFGERVLLYHSRQSGSYRARCKELLARGDEPYLVLGLRSALFLPFSNLGLVVVDEEHDSSYKQESPAPRYGGRDSALMLAKIWGAEVLLGSATPSLESIYNSYRGLYSLVELESKYFKGPESKLEVIDTIRERQRGAMEGIFSNRVLEAIEERLERGEQILIFRNRRSYSPMVQCLYCGDIPHCTNCNVALNYHKRRGLLKCHYCSYSRAFSTICRVCGKPGLKERGVGTEMIEEEIARLFPSANVVRLDSEISTSKREAKRVLKSFSSGESQILVGTQMVSKGFDFEKLTLVVLIEADSLFAMEDFRATEKAMQLLVQLSGRGGRRELQSTLMVQSGQPKHRIYRDLFNRDNHLLEEIKERKEFNYPPFNRLIKIVLRGRVRERLEEVAQEIATLLPTLGVNQFNGPFTPAIEWVRGEHHINFWIKLKREEQSQALKSRLYRELQNGARGWERAIKIHFDVDPL